MTRLCSIMMKTCMDTLSTLLVMMFRIAAILVLACLLYFPAFKGIWAGYAPVAAAVVLVWLISVRGTRENPLPAVLAGMREIRFTVLLLAIPAVIQVGLILLFRSESSFDGFFVMRDADRFIRTGEMPPLTYYAPAQIWYYAFFFKLFGTHDLVAQLCQVPLACGTVWVGYRLAGRFMSWPHARMAALGMALYPTFLAYVLVTPYYYYLYTLMLMLMVFAWVAVALGAGGKGAAFAGGLCAGFGALTKATFLVAPAQTLCFWILSAGQLFGRRVWIAWSLFVVAMVLAIFPWTLRNVRVFGEPVWINTSGGLVLYSANNPESDGLYSSIPDQADIQTPREMLEHSRWCTKQAVAFIREHPGHFAYLAWMKILHTWGTETTYTELVNWRGRRIPRLDQGLRFVSQTGWAMLVFLWAGVSFRALRRREPPDLLEMVVAILVLSKFIIYSVYEGGMRHHLPVVPLLMVWVVMRRGASFRK